MMKGKSEEREVNDLISGDLGPAQSVAVFSAQRLFSLSLATLLFSSRIFLSCWWIHSYITGSIHLELC
jgi:hypothetical protein